MNILGGLVSLPFLVKALVAVVAFAVLFVGWYSFTIAGNASDNQIVQMYGNVCLSGLCVSQFASQTFGLFEIAIGVGMLMVLLYVFLAAFQEEPTAWEMQ